MKTVKVEIKGLSPLLMNSPKSMIDQMTESKLKQTTKKIDVYKDADKLAYKLDSNEIKSILEEAGSRIGILDFRPDKLGSFGMFEVTKWEEK
jgi:hypothetical protein